MQKSFVSLKRIILTAVFSAVGISFVFASPVNAQYGNGQYGTTSGNPDDLNINKMVRRNTNPFDFVENLGENDVAYTPDTDIIFRLRVTNSGNQTFEEVSVRDTLPENIVSARVADNLKGEFSKPILFFVLKDLKAGETRDVDVTAHIAKQENLNPKDKSVICETNYVVVTSEDRKDDDSASYCIRPNVLGTTVPKILPKAGMEDYLPLLPFIALGLAGIGLVIKPNFKKV